MMYAGIDYPLNRDYDLYFNLMYAGFDRALRKGVKRIHVGQTATGVQVADGLLLRAALYLRQGHRVLHVADVPLRVEFSGDQEAVESALGHFQAAPV